MILNKALGLTAVGVVGLASVAQAGETQMNAVETAISATTISGYVDTSAQWNQGTGNANLPEYKFGGPSKADGFNLNVIQLRIEKPLDESEWAAGYRVDLWLGPDANTLGTQSVFASGTSDFAVRQAYVTLRAPLGNGITFKMGVFDSIIGYESVESANNANFTRSYGHTIEPQTHTGLLATYRFSDAITSSLGVANTIGPAIDDRAFPTSARLTGDFSESFKTYLFSLALTAPESFGWAAGSSLQFGWVNGFYDTGQGTGFTQTPVSGLHSRDSSYGFTQTSWYIGAKTPTPITGLTVGLTWDYREFRNSAIDDWAAAGYASYQATEKLSFHARLDYFNTGEGAGAGEMFAVTGTVQYDLWKNVLSRLELRWDHSANGLNAFGGDTSGEPTKKNAFMVAMNVIYKF
jgi:hypothetical protein